MLELCYILSSTGGGNLHSAEDTRWSDDWPDENGQWRQGWSFAETLKDGCSFRWVSFNVLPPGINRRTLSPDKVGELLFVGYFANKHGKAPICVVAPPTESSLMNCFLVVAPPTECYQNLNMFQLLAGKHFVSEDLHVFGLHNRRKCNTNHLHVFTMNATLYLGHYGDMADDSTSGLLPPIHDCTILVCGPFARCD